MRWSDIIVLVKQTPKEDNPVGFEPKVDESSRDVFCNVTGTWSSDFYAALQAGIVLSHRATVRTADYEGERIAELNVKRYTVTRTDLSNNGEFTVLTLADEKNRVDGDGV